MNEVTRIKKNSQDQINLFNLQTNEFYLEEGAQLNLLQINFQNSGLTPQKVKITQEKDSALHVFSFFMGCEDIENEMEVHLNGTNANAEFYGLYALQGNEKSAQNISVYHNVPHTFSTQLCKGILKDNSKAKFTGKIRVEEDAQKVQAAQLNKNLILGEKAKVDTQPFLEIFADDVKCSHGATVGQLQTEDLFYLQSRGIPREEATKILIHAFAEEILFKLNDENLRGQLSDSLNHSYFI